MCQVCWSRMNCETVTEMLQNLLPTEKSESNLTQDLLSTGPQVSLTNELPPDPPLAWSDHWGPQMCGGRVSPSRRLPGCRKNAHIVTPLSPLLVDATLEALTTSSLTREEYSFCKAEVLFVKNADKI